MILKLNQFAGAEDEDVEEPGHEKKGRHHFSIVSVWWHESGQSGPDDPETSLLDSSGGIRNLR